MPELSPQVLLLSGFGVQLRSCLTALSRSSGCCCFGCSGCCDSGLATAAVIPVSAADVS